MIEVDNLSFRYPDGQQALNGVSLKVYPGERVAIVGPNGAGKSTLILHLNGILASEDGRVRVAGLPVAGEHVKRVRALVGLVFQDPDDQLFSPTVFEDVAYGPVYMGLPEGEVRRRVSRALAAVGMESYADRVPHRLSAGEKKRIALATVLAMEPSVLVLDEPTAGLDPRGRRMLIRLLDSMTQTMIVSTHDLLMVRDLFPRMVILDRGRVVADGSTADLLRDQALLEAHGLELP
ncbi:MAG: ABC transporter ATP-binding protein [Chloroflexi bacterium]|nr:ABC transporter ATP-binding protein [Chloroflexota bacterium]